MMQQAIEKANTLLEALQWIREFRNKFTVIKLGGSVMTNPVAMSRLLLDVIFMETVGMRPIIVHGGGPTINRAMAEAGIKPVWVQGRRYTDEQTLSIVEKTLGRELNEQLADQITILGGHAEPLNFRTHNVLFGRKLKLFGEDGKLLDLGSVGEVTRIDEDYIRYLVEYKNVIPVIPSMALDDESNAGGKLNVNADSAANIVAQRLHADKLIFLTDINGVRRDKNDPSTLINSLNSKEAQALIDEHVVDAGMIPKLQACIDTVNKGVKQVHIIDGGVRHSLLLEIYTNTGIGTEIHK